MCSNFKKTLIICKLMNQRKNVFFFEILRIPKTLIKLQDIKNGLILLKVLN